MTYKDRTWCTLGVLCKTYVNEGCDRVMTEEDARIIEKEQLMCSFFGDIPKCFKAVFDTGPTACPECKCGTGHKLSCESKGGVDGR